LSFPIDFHALSESVRRFHLDIQLRDELVKKRTEKGISQSPLKLITSLFALSKEEEQELDHGLTEAMSSGVRPSGELHLIRLQDRIMEIIGQLFPEQRMNALWLEKNDIIENLRSNPNAGMDLLHDHVRTLFLRFSEDYPRIIDVNFPTFKSNISFRSHFPISIVIGLNREKILQHIQNDFFHAPGTILLFGAFNDGSTEVLTTDANEIVDRFPNYIVRGRPFKATRSSGFEVFKYLFSSDSDIGAFRNTDGRQPLHNLIYDELKDDVRTALRRNRA
jgi:hypothetical protein